MCEPLAKKQARKAEFFGHVLRRMPQPFWTHFLKLETENGTVKLLRTLSAIHPRKPRKQYSSRIVELRFNFLVILRWWIDRCVHVKRFARDDENH